MGSTQQKQYTPYPYLNIGFSILLVFLLAGIFKLTAPDFKDIYAYKIAPDKVSFIDADDDLKPRRIRVNETIKNITKQWSPFSHTPRQFNTNIKLDWSSSETTEQKWALYIPAIGGDASLYINGMGITASTPANMGAHGSGSQHIFTELPTSIFQPGVNRVTLVFFGDGSKAGLKSLYFGPAVKLRPIYENQRTSAQSKNYLLLFLGITLVAGAIIAITSGERQWPCFIIGIFGILCVGQYYIHSQIENYVQLVTRGLPWLHALKFGLLLLLGYFHFIKGKRANSIEAGLFVFALFAFVIGYLPYIHPSLGVNTAAENFANFGAMPLLLTLIYSRITYGMKEEQTRAQVLRQLVLEKEQSLLLKEQELQAQLQKAAVLKERQRLTRDMHDGIGGQLLSLLVRVRGGKLTIDEIQDDIQSGINDLRLIVDSMDTSGNDINVALATLRTRVKAQLDAAKIELNWQQSPKLNLNKAGTREILNIYRLIQEAVTNVQRHANAKNVNINIAQKKPKDPIHITIKDDGIGMQKLPKKKKAGKGLTNMKTRAQKLGGALEFGKGIDGQGLGVSLTFPSL